MFSPIRCRSVPYRISDVELGSAFHQQPDRIKVSGKRRLMERSAMAVAVFWVVAVGILACIEQSTNNFSVSELRGKCQR